MKFEIFRMMDNKFLNLIVTIIKMRNGPGIF